MGSGSRPRAVSPVLSWEGARELSRSPERVWIEAWTSDISSRTVASSRWQGRRCEEQEQGLGGEPEGPAGREGLGGA